VAAPLAVLLAAVFGAGTQYLGSWLGASWATEVSLVSAPWLLLGFLAGCTQRRSPVRAALLGLACTLAALAGYFVMILSPVEGAHAAAREVAGVLRTNVQWILGGLVTGPLFGWFGHRWRSRRSWPGAAITAGAFALEPLAHLLGGRPIGPKTSAVEVIAGLLMLGYVGAAQGRARRRQTP
jgi:hypothetical protein